MADLSAKQLLTTDIILFDAFGPILDKVFSQCKISLLYALICGGKQMSTCQLQAHLSFTCNVKSFGKISAQTTMQFFIAKHGSF